MHAGLVESLSDSLVKLSDTEATPMIKVLALPARQAEREQSLLERLKRAIEARELQRVVKAEKSPRGVLLRMDDSLLFPKGATELAPRSLVFLRDVATLIREVPGPISIEGHTDATRGSARSNWGLAADRAVAVLTHLVDAEGIEAKRLQATAFGDTRPLAPNVRGARSGPEVGAWSSSFSARRSIWMQTSGWVGSSRLRSAAPRTRWRMNRELRCAGARRRGIPGARGPAQESRETLDLCEALRGLGLETLHASGTAEAADLLGDRAPRVLVLLEGALGDLWNRLSRPGA